MTIPTRFSDLPSMQAAIQSPGIIWMGDTAEGDWAAFKQGPVVARITRSPDRQKYPIEILRGGHRYFYSGRCRTMTDALIELQKRLAKALSAPVRPVAVAPPHPSSSGSSGPE
jgi:hypothetical protein